MLMLDVCPKPVSGREGADCVYVLTILAGSSRTPPLLQHLQHLPTIAVQGEC